MELLVTLRNTRNIEKILGSVDGVIIGNKFTVGFNYTLDDITKIVRYCQRVNKKVYIVMDDFICEDDLIELNSYLEFISSLDVDGIYFHDLAVYDAASTFNLKNKLIYDGKTVLCNSLESAYYLSKGINSVVISRELTKEEVLSIITSNPNRVDLQIFGHLRLSYSKRRFVSNYLKQINRPYDIAGKDDFFLREELRDYKLPVIEDENGTRVYSDYILEMYDEINNFKPYLKRGIIDTLFINDAEVLQVVRDYRKVSKDNCSFLKERLNYNFPNKYSSGYLYLKTNITKDE